jgi:hypothetical protein
MPEAMAADVRRLLKVKLDVCPSVSEFGMWRMQVYNSRSSISVVGDNAPLKEETLVCCDIASDPKGAKVFRGRSIVS